ncbi:hypothetical protein SRHO_G00028510 [Serrasalmus rhombeus]
MEKGLLNGKFHFKSLPDGSLDKTKAVCQAEFSYHQSTSSLKYHMEAKHTFGSRFSSGNVRQTTLDNVRWQTMDQPTSNKLTVAIAKWIATACRPINMVEDKSLHDIIRIASKDPSHELPSRSTIVNRVHKLYEMEREVMGVEHRALVMLVSLVRAGHAQVYYKPVLTVQPERPQIFTGETVTLACYIPGESVTDWRSAADQDQDQYWCRGERDYRPSSSQYSNRVGLSVNEKPKPELTSSHKGAALIGNPVVLYCKLDQSAGWRFYWSKHTQSPENETKTETHSYTISSVSLSDGGQYWCRAGRGTPVYYTHYSDALWINTTGVSPPVSLTVSPSRTQHFSADSLSLSCEGQSDSTGRRVRRYTHSEKVSDCSSGWGSVTGSTCSISSLNTSHTGVYWCESESGESSNPVNITVTNRAHMPVVHIAANRELLSEEERKADQQYWSEPNLTKYENFLVTLELWIIEVKQQAKIAHEQAATEYEAPKDGVMTQQGELAAEELAAEDVHPDDSVSMVQQEYASVPAQSVCSKRSKGSNVSSYASSIRRKEEAHRAALLARAAALEKKEALQLEEAQIEAQLKFQKIQMKTQMEKLDFETALAESTAKLRVLEEYENMEDGMNSYLNKNMRAATTMPRPDVRPTSYPRVIPDNTAFHVPARHMPYVHVKNENEDVAGTRPGAKQVELGEVILKQKDITEMLVTQQRLANLPQRKVPEFSGDPFEFLPFLRAFEHIIHSRTDNDADRLYYLEQFTTGEPRELVRSCQHMSAQQGYKEARKLLTYHYGNEQRIAAAYVERTVKWPQIKAEDAKSLHSFSIFLTGCHNVVNDLEYLAEMNSPSNLRIIVHKLPFRLRERWRVVAFDIQEKEGRRADFADLVGYINRQAKIASDPLFGDVKDPHDAKEKCKSSAKSAMGRLKRTTGLATSVTPADDSSESRKTKQTSNAFQEPCLYCNKGHTLSACNKIRGLLNKERIEFLKGKSKKHPTLLHTKREEDGNQAIAKPEKSSEGFSSERSTPREQVSSKSELSAVTGAGGSDCILSIVPVRIKSKKSNNTIETYAFMDSGSSATFCSERLMRRLGVIGKRTQVLLRTMGQEKPVSCFVLSDLEVCGLTESKYISLPDVYTHTDIPVTRENVPAEKDLESWPYLRKEVRLPQIDADVEMLIGMNAHSAMEPWKIIHSQDDGPYAIKTTLGWVVNGPLKKDNDHKPSHFSHGVSVNRVSVSNVDSMLLRQYNHDFPEQACEEKSEMSREDIQFMRCVTETTKKINGHYCIGMPLRNKDVVMPNNKCVAEQRASSLKRKLTKNSSFHDDYTAFVSDLLSKGYAVEVPANELNRNDGRVCNSREVLSSLPENERAKEIKNLDLDRDKLPMERALGVDWCIESDSFKFRIFVKNMPVTRRGILSIVSSIYDPLGFLSPFILLAKTILQNLCRMKLTWDDEIPEDLANRWCAWLSDLSQFASFSVKRCIKPEGFGPVVSAQLHHFSDASEKGYGIVSYIRIENSHGQVHCSFLLGKSRVTPLKPVTVPRLELTAATIAVKMDKLMKRELRMDLKDSVLWTDSTTVLRYIDNDGARFKTFVANRVSTIRENTRPTQWRYVSTSSNPADHASRGMKAEYFMKCQHWIEGPDFLAKDESHWPVLSEFSREISDDDAEVKRKITVNIINASNPSTDPLFKLIHHYSSWLRLRKAVAWMLRLKELLRNRCERRKVFESQTQSPVSQDVKPKIVEDHMQKWKSGLKGTHPTVKDIRRAETAIIQFSQRQTFHEELCALQKGDKIRRSSFIVKLDPFLQDGVLRVGGRLHHAALPEHTRHPAILAKNHHVTTLIIRNAHEEIGHGGRNHTLAQLRQRVWICKGNAAISEALLQKGVTWIFNPPAGSHHGGIWERQIRTVRKVLTSVLKLQSLDDECLYTVMCEVEAVINSRPLTKSSDDVDDLEPLTPNHLLLLKGKPALPPGIFQKEDLYCRRRWRQVQYISDIFWKRWSREYLPLLQERQKWLEKKRNVKEGDVVLIVDERAPRGSWLMGKVEKTIPDDQGFVRRVLVKTKTNTLERPIDKLCLLLEMEEYHGQ